MEENIGKFPKRVMNKMLLQRQESCLRNQFALCQLTKYVYFILTAQGVNQDFPVFLYYLSTSIFFLGP